MIKVVNFFVLVVCVLTYSTFAADKDPVIFVHGLGGTSGTFTEMMDFFTNPDNGANIVYSTDELHTFSYNSISVSIPKSAEKLKTKVDSIVNDTNKRVDIVAYSLGAVVTRYYLKAYPDALSKVDAWISLGGPNNGITAWDAWLACNFWGITGMCAMKPDGTVLSYLNEGDPTPQTSDGLPRYITMVSEEDNNNTLDSGKYDCPDPADPTGNTELEDSSECASYMAGATNITTEDELHLSFGHFDYYPSTQESNKLWQEMMALLYQRNFVAGHLK